MTTIVYREGVLAADSQAYCGSRRVSLGTKVKVRRLEDGTLIGASSSIVGATDDLLDWYEHDTPLPEKYDSFQLLVVNPDGSAFLAFDNTSLSGPITGDYYAIGSGEDFALGALAMGASAEEAVRIASQFDYHTNDKILSISH